MHCFLFCNSYINETARISIFQDRQKENDVTNEDLILQLRYNCLVGLHLDGNDEKIVWRETPLILMTE